MTLVLRFDLDMVKMYHNNKNEVSMSMYSKVIARTERETRRQYEKILPSRTRDPESPILHSIVIKYNSHNFLAKYRLKFGVLMFLAQLSQRQRCLYDIPHSPPRIRLNQGCPVMYPP